MKLLFPHEVPRTGIEHIIYRRPWWRPAFAIVIIVIASVAWADFVAKEQDGNLFMYAALLISLAAFWLAYKDLRGALKSSNWLVRQASGGLYVKFRSYLNYHFPDETPTIIYIPKEEITSAHLTKQKIVVRGSDEADGVQTRRYLDLHLSHSDTAEYADAIRKEIAYPGPKQWSGTGKFNSYPVQLRQPNLVRIEWHARPNIKTALQNLRRFTTIEEPLHIQDKNWKKLSQQEAETKILEFCQHGETIQAVKLVRAKMGMNLTDAKSFVDDLVQDN
jgi:hypothetical protein